MRHSLTRNARRACVAIVLLGAAPALALALGAPDLRGAVEVAASDPWADLAALDVVVDEFADGPAGEEDMLDMLAREERGDPVEAPERRVSVRTADPATAAQSLTGPERAPDWRPVPPTTVSTSVAVYPRDTWGGGRPSIALLGY